MGTKVLEKKPQAIRQKVELVNGVFTASESADLINNLIDEKINFHKIQRLQRWEGNHNCKTTTLNSRITELENIRVQAMEFISELRSQGKSIRIEGNLSFSVAEEGNN